MKPVIFHAGAELDLRAAAAYYERERKGLGRELREEVEAAVGRIRRSPRLFPRHDQFGTRKCLVRRFPYTIFFVELEDQIWIAAVAHQKREPGYWSGRRPD